MTPCHKAALEYLARGWSVLPIDPTKSGPDRYLIKWKEFQTRHATAKEVADWYRRWPQAGVAVVTGAISGLVVIDVDTRKGGDPAVLPPTSMTAQTPSGGVHGFYRHPGTPVRNSVEKWAKGVDVRGDGGIAILAPTERGDGTYTWTETGEPGEWPGHPSSTDDGAIELEIGSDIGTIERSISDIITAGAGEGERNTTLTRLAGYLASKALSPDIVLAICRQWSANLAAPIEDAEIRATVRSVCDMERAKDVKSSAQPLTVLPIGDFLAQFWSAEIEWLVEGCVPRHTIGFYVSPPECFKTWLTFDLAVSVASGVPFLGQFPVKAKGPVLVLQQEDFHGQTAQRFSVILNGKIPAPEPKILPDGVIELQGQDIPPVYVQVDRGLSFADKRKVAELETLIATYRPELVIIDPMYSIVPIDNYMEKAAAQLRPLKLWRDKYGTSFLLVHHSKKIEGLNFDRQASWGSQFLNAFVEFGAQVRKLSPTEIVFSRHFKAAPAGLHVKVEWKIDVENGVYDPIVAELTSDDVAELAEDAAPKPSGRKRYKVEIDNDDSASDALQDHDGAVFAALNCDPRTAKEVQVDSGLSFGHTLAALSRLAKEGSIVKAGKGWVRNQ